MGLFEATDGELWFVEAGSVGADGNALAGGTEQVDISAGCFAGDPFGGAIFGGCSAIEAGGEFQDGVGFSCFSVVEVGAQATSCFFGSDAGGDFNSSGTKGCDSPSRNMGVGIFEGDDDVLDASLNECVDAGGSLSVMGARFEGDVGSCSFSKGARLFEGDNFGVVGSTRLGESFSNNFFVFDDHAAYPRVGRCGETPLFSKGEGVVHKKVLLSS